MAYASLLSLAQTTAEIIFLYPISQKKKQQIRSIYEPFIHLQEFLEEFPEKAHNLEGRMRDVAHEAEDIIISFILKETAPHWRAVLAAKLKFRRRMRKMRRETDSIAKEVRNIKRNCGAAEAAVRLGDSPAASSVTSSRNTDNTVGLHDDLVAIKSRLCGESPNLQVIPIVGMGGIGKTTLAKTIYDDPLTVQHFEIRAWVTISQDYDADVILSCLLASMEEYNKERCEQSSELVGEKVFKNLKSRRYLIAIDDIWSTKAWDDITYILPDDGNGSRIMLTTRLIDVAAYPDPCSPLHKMRLMDDDQSWNLLRQKVFPHQDCPLELRRIGREIARNCSGLPLAIVLAAGLLSTVSKNQDSWRDIAENVNSVVASKEHSEKILSLSYNHLPHYLKPCFLYMGMFPKDQEIRVSKLLKLWAAEGFLRNPNGSKSLEEEAEECLEDLVRRNLVLVTNRKSDGKIKSCSLHDLMRDLCIRKADEEKFLVCFRGGYDRKFIPTEVRKNQPRVSVTPSGLPYLSKIFGLTTHTILCFHSIILVLDYLRSFRLLRILDTGDVYVRSLPDQLFELFHLVYLSIYCHGSISSDISKLQNLQTFNIRARNEWRIFKAHSICLPKEIWLMPQLRHLICYGRLSEPEGRISCILENLQTLSIVSHVMCSENTLRAAPNLRKLEIDCSEGRQGKIYLNSLVHLRQLENLKLRSAFTNAFFRKDILTFPETLRKLTLSRLPLPWEEMTVVGSLPNLRVLKLTHHACKGSTWETAEGEFPQLEFLLIEKSYLEHWLTESSHFPRLKCLLLDDCSRLTGLPNCIGEIPTLELIEVKGEAEKSLSESVKWIREEQQAWGNDELQVRCRTHSKLKRT